MRAAYVLIAGVSLWVGALGLGYTLWRKSLNNPRTPLR